jgi:putative ABC transport system substrate-binding protein
MTLSQKQISLIAIIGLTVLALVAPRILLKKKSTASYTVAILQTASHPALDAARQGLVDELNAKLGNDVEYIIHNAQGSVANMHLIAQQLQTNKKINAIYAIATPALQAIAGIEKVKPILMSAVTDPYSLGIMQTNSNICGVTDMINMEKEIEMLHLLMPEAKTAALLYSSAEVNSLKQAQLIKEQLIKYGIEPMDISVIQESDVPNAINLACRKADVIIAPSDNIIASSMELVASTALAHKKPLIACYNQAVNQGALASRGVDYYECGKQIAQYAYQIIKQSIKPSEIGIIKPASDKIYINKKTLEALGLKIPGTLEDSVTIIE